MSRKFLVFIVMSTLNKTNFTTISPSAAVHATPTWTLLPNVFNLFDRISSACPYSLTDKYVLQSRIEPDINCSLWWGNKDFILLYNLSDKTESRALRTPDNIDTEMIP